VTDVAIALHNTPGSESWSTKVRQRARSLVKAIDRGYIELAEIIHTVWATPIDGVHHNACVCVAWGYDNYVQWAEEELGLHKRKAERLKAVWHHLNITLGNKLDEVTRRRVLALGFTKVRELIRVIDENNVDRWVEMAEHLDHSELCAAVRQALEDQAKEELAKAVGTLGDDEEEWHGADPPDDLDRFKTIKFWLTPEQKANVEMAIERAKRLAESTKPGHCLDLICTDFLSTNDFGKRGDQNSHLRILAKFERLLSKRLVVIDPKTWVIEYGMDALSRAAEVFEAAEEDDDGADTPDKS